ncbi:N-acetylmuramoyl-L-alanine amidase [Streptomyces sp. NBC_00316]|uniref:N-acetylmuramoyl-L-alanine amidase n=1 Tax=Streptomyces sp. NBC_00316 TaxID=2975710 RepID=UPI002E2E17D9|nr:N-acetylmuramoyl-L-alanine amidase [Streptomyces sp. NBC_00316]
MRIFLLTCGDRRIIEVGNWLTHNRNSRGVWGRVNGVMIHHSVTKGTAAMVGIVRNAYADLPGPLCHGMIAKDGRVHLIGYGRTDHAGLGDGDVLQAVVAERRLPSDDETNTDGNRHFYGFECESLGDGKDPWPDVQLEAIEKVSAAICRHRRPRRQPSQGDSHGWSDVEKELSGVIVTAAVALVTISPDPEKALAERAQGLRARLDLN